VRQPTRFVPGGKSYLEVKLGYLSDEIPKYCSAPGDVHLWSVAPASVNREYHRIWGCVKRNPWTATSCGFGGAHGIEKMTLCKAPYRFGGV
jgi:hypothetical protein